MTCNKKIPLRALRYLCLIFVLVIGLTGIIASGDGDEEDSDITSPDWTWISGDSTVNQSGVYGTKGTGSTSNKPGSRNSSVSWIDSSDNLWLFGGWGGDASGDWEDLNDLWRYTPTTGEWTWVSGDKVIDQCGVYGTKGTGSTSNKPGAREYSVSWTDASGNLWLFGGWGYSSTDDGDLNDLWRYTPTTGEWIWVSGDETSDQYGIYGEEGTGSASNKPGARESGVSWIDPAGNLWLFGGSGKGSSGDPGSLNDLWKFVFITGSTGEWTWVSGDNLIDQYGVYGTKGTGSTSNSPGARELSVSWTDSSGNLWLFGGYGIDGSGNTGELNDLWKFAPSTGEWTWVSGDKVIDQYGVYGTKGTGSASNKPGARESGVSWTDTSGNLWLFGGYGIDGSGNTGELNDLWKFAPSTGEWTWVSGNKVIDQAGVYGTKGTGSSSNKPGVRYSSVSWIDTTGDLWLFGGYGIDGSGDPGDLNDLWKCEPEE